MNGHAATKSYRLPLVVAFTALALFAVLQRRLVETFASWAALCES